MRRSKRWAYWCRRRQSQGDSAKTFRRALRANTVTGDWATAEAKFKQKLLGDARDVSAGLNPADSERIGLLVIERRCRVRARLSVPLDSKDEIRQFLFQLKSTLRLQKWRSIPARWVYSLQPISLTIIRS